MTERIIGLVHTTRLVVDRVHDAITTAFPDFRPVHLMDETLLMDFAATGGVNARVRRKLLSMVRSAEDCGASMVLVTCSSLGDTVSDVQKFVDIPVLKVDEPMAEEVVTRARTVGILATAPSAAAGTAGLIKHAADESGKSVECKTFLCPEAGAHLAQGIKSFNEYLAGKACEACPQVDALVVAQLSMCGLEDFTDESSTHGKIFTSLPYAIRKMQAMLNS